MTQDFTPLPNAAGSRSPEGLNVNWLTPLNQRLVPQFSKAVKRLPRRFLGVLGLSLIALSCANQSPGFGSQARSHAYLNALDAQLADAAGRGDSAEVRRLVSAGANPNATGREGVTPLLWALSKQNLQGFIALLESGADPNKQHTSITKDGQRQQTSAMEIATITKDSRFLQAALAHGGNPNLPAYDSVTLLFEAITHQRYANIEMLIRAGADINHQHSFGRTPAMSAAAIKCYDVVYLLLQHGADPTLKDRTGYDLAHIMVRYGGLGRRMNAKETEGFIKVREILHARGLL